MCQDGLDARENKLLTGKANFFEIGSNKKHRSCFMFAFILTTLSSILFYVSIIIFMSSIIFFAEKSKNRLISGGIAIAIGAIALIFNVISGILNFIRVL